MDTSDPHLMSVRPAARMLGVSIGTLRRWSDTGLVPTYRTLGGQRRYKQSDLENLLTSMFETRETQNEKE